MSTCVIRPITDAKVWQQAIDQFDYNTFLHNRGWVDFNNQYGHKTFQLGLYSAKDELLSIALVLKISAKRGTFLFIPHGPQFAPESEQNLLFLDQIKAWKDYLVTLGKHEQCDFIRISPILPQSLDNELLFSKNGFRPSPIHMHAELTTVVDLLPDEKKIVKNMRKTMRQMIKKGQTLLNEGQASIEIVSSIDDEMHRVYQATALRGVFVPFSRMYLQKEYEAFAAYNNAVMCKITHNNQVLSWGMWIFSGQRAFYHQGANILHKNIPASYMSHWFGMQQAKERGCKTYDFWGVGPVDKSNHPWANISRFKRGFGGQDFCLVHAQDYPLRWKYWLTWAVEKVRALKRGF